MHLYLIPLFCLAVGTHLAKAAPTQPWVKAIDLSYSMPDAFWGCVKNEGVQKLIFLAFAEHCAIHGQGLRGGHPENKKGDTIMITDMYHAAINLGKFSTNDIDLYFFPCTDERPGECLSPKEQVDSFISFLDINSISVNTLWLDIEFNNGDPCHTWNRQPDENIQMAKDYITLIRNTGRQWGIYTELRNYAHMFGDYNEPLAPDLPLWIVDVDQTAGLKTKPLPGGWTSATVKQWAQNVTLCGNTAFNVDIDSYAISPALIQIPVAPQPGPRACKTTGDGLRYRTCPHLSCTPMGQYPLGQVVDFSCRATGDPVVGDWPTNYWGKASNGYYTSLAYIDQTCAQGIVDCPV